MSVPRYRDHMSRWSRVGAIFALLVMTLVACSSDPGWPPPGEARGELASFPVNAQIVVGENRMLFNIIDRQNQSVAAPDTTVDLRFFDMATSRTQPAAENTATYITTAPGRPGLYRAEATFDKAGEWGVEATATAANGSKQTGRFVFNVREAGTTPPIGAAAPASTTPTATTADEIARISTDDDPDPDFYRQSVADALAAQQPFAVVFATPAFCTSATCAPTLDLVKTSAAEFKDRMAFIHVEPYQLEFVDGSLHPVLSPQNRPISVAATQEWGLPTEPYVFVVDSAGRVAAKFEGTASADELREAFTQVAAG